MKSCGVILNKDEHCVWGEPSHKTLEERGPTHIMKPKVYTQPTTEPRSQEYHDLCVSFDSEYWTQTHHTRGENQTITRITWMKRQQSTAE